MRFGSFTLCKISPLDSTMNISNQKINTTKSFKPFVRWAGGKTQLLPQLIDKIPDFIKNGDKFNYVEPFLGGGSFFFYIIENYNPQKCYVNDLNKNLIGLYKNIKNDFKLLEIELEKIKIQYSKTISQKDFYYDIRNKYNALLDPNSVLKSAYLLFLNKTCFNGIYRENKNGEFNVPKGNKNNPEFYSLENLKLVSKKLNEIDIIIHSKSFEKIDFSSDLKTFYFLDPPYREIKNKKSFNEYLNQKYSNEEIQFKLSDFCQKITNRNQYFMQTNSYTNDDFFQKLYSNDSYNISTIEASRRINSKGNKRGLIKEVMIRNYK
tara:strand:+ start:5279 stop:6241 length:963 start_codon:yes stop_codon:yes gene_type:complete